MYWSRIYVLSALIWKNKHNVKTVKAYFWPDRRIGWIGLSWNFKVLQWINLNESFWDLIIYNMKIMWRDFKRIRSSRFRNIQKSAKSSNLNEVALIQVGRWENGLVFKIARTKTHQNFLTSKYDVQQHSDAT